MQTGPRLCWQQHTLVCFQDLHMKWKAADSFNLDIIQGYKCQQISTGAKLIFHLQGFIKDLLFAISKFVKADFLLAELALPLALNIKAINTDKEKSK